MFKLETIDTDGLHIEWGSFVEIGSVQNIYISNSILSNETKMIFVELFKSLNLNPTRRNGRTYFKSLSLISSSDKYDCGLTLDFIKQKIHFNFKTESDIFNYFSECSQMSLNKSLQANSIRINRNTYTFTEPFLFFIWITLILIIVLSLFFVSVNHAEWHGIV